MIKKGLSASSFKKKSSIFPKSTPKTNSYHSKPSKDPQVSAKTPKTCSPPSAKLPRPISLKFLSLTLTSTQKPMKKTISPEPISTVKFLPTFNTAKTIQNLLPLKISTSRSPNHKKYLNSSVPWSKSQKPQKKNSTAKILPYKLPTIQLNNKVIRLIKIPPKASKPTVKSKSKAPLKLLNAKSKAPFSSRNTKTSHTGTGPNNSLPPTKRNSPTVLS